MSYHITEPHPTPRSNIMHTGRGGAGNVHKLATNDISTRNHRISAVLSAPSTASSSSSASSRSSQHAATKFSAGRGGAGNIHNLTAAAVPYSFDDEARRQASFEAHHDVYHVGRGGAGNWARKDSVSSDRKMSSGSDGSARSGFMGRLSGIFERN